MTLSSMTGFARTEGETGDTQWAWELRSVNGRNLDIRCRVPGGYEALDQRVRKEISASFKRGSIQVNLQLKRQGGLSELSVNEAALEQLLKLIGEVSDRVEAKKPTLDGILGLKGVLDLKEPEETEEESARRFDALVEGLQDAIQSLKSARQAEGEAMAIVIADQVKQIKDLTSQASQTADAQPARLKERVETQLAELLEAKPPVAEERLAQELALLITKADVREEIDRLLAHCDAADELLSGSGPVGRKLDFLMQEFNREANTICSKASSVELTRIGIELKTVIDQMREQVQNIE